MVSIFENYPSDDGGGYDLAALMEFNDKLISVYGRPGLRDIRDNLILAIRNREIQNRRFAVIYSIAFFLWTPMNAILLFWSPLFIFIPNMQWGIICAFFFPAFAVSLRKVVEFAGEDYERMPLRAWGVALLHLSFFIVGMDLAIHLAGWAARSTRDARDIAVGIGIGAAYYFLYVQVDRGIALVCRKIPSWRLTAGDNALLYAHDALRHIKEMGGGSSNNRNDFFTSLENLAMEIENRFIRAIGVNGNDLEVRGRLNSAATSIRSLKLRAAFPDEDAKRDVAWEIALIIGALGTGLYGYLPSEPVLAEAITVKGRVKRLLKGLRHLIAGILPLAALLVLSQTNIPLPGELRWAWSLAAVAWALVVVLALIDPQYRDRMTATSELLSMFRSGSLKKNSE